MHRRNFLLGTSAAALTACSRSLPPPEIQAAPPNAKIQRIYVATQHGDLETFRNFGNPRVNRTRYFEADISIPPGHTPGKIETAPHPDPEKHFALVGAEEHDLGGFLRALDSGPGEKDRVAIFVHGYNTNIQQAGLRLAQLKTDYLVPFPTIAFAWPSSGQLLGYVYDRDSVLFARDGLENLIREVRRRTGRKIVLAAHSMGTFLSMEVMRSMALKSPGDPAHHIDELYLISPDIDAQVFERQIAPIRPLPDPFFVVSAPGDRALRLSSFITGEAQRLGVVTQNEALSARGIQFIDVGRFAGDDRLGHNVPFNSPGAIRALSRQLADGGRLLL
ncbi:putative lipoprotein [Candidatus Rhodobacter oscarellae]|uniref:Putative lipoprotein n=1 Tax=Candidatus Rhodobacter oscarellae TaxID=1675527 RepID=A0A0J9E4Z9_9RHOB|nr:alpha/beta fold hydrolase [Candidatus Rhodobacter lobularis]KMW57816.1 putative lipoprotein [Candidatus Rhodobacter lobularis]